MFCVEDGKRWEAKFHGAQGRLQQVESALRQEIGALQAQISTLEDGVRERDAQIAQLSQAATEAATLREQIATLQAEAAKASRLQAVMRFPDLLSLTVTEEVTVVEGDAEHTEERTRNPVLTFLDNTTLEGDELIAALQDLAKATGRPSAPQAPAGDATAGAVPSPAAPATPASEIDAARQEAMRWHQDAIDGRHGPNGEDPREMEEKAWAHFRDLQRKQAQAA